MTNAILDITEMVREELKDINLELPDFVFDSGTKNFEFSFAHNDDDVVTISISTDLDQITDGMPDTEKQKQAYWLIEDIKFKYERWVFADG